MLCLDEREKGWERDETLPVDKNGLTLLRQSFIHAIIPVMLSSKEKEPLIKKAQKHDKDTGSAEVQIAVITERINRLAGHLKKNKKDNHSRRGLVQLVSTRRKHLQYLEKTNKKSYEKILKSIKLKDDKK